MFIELLNLKLLCDILPMLYGKKVSSHYQINIGDKAVIQPNWRDE